MCYNGKVRALPSTPFRPEQGWSIMTSQNSPEGCPSLSSWLKQAPQVTKFKSSIFQPVLCMIIEFVKKKKKNSF